MLLSGLNNHVFVLGLFVFRATAAGFNVSGDALTQRYWDCCKPSCSWKFKADVSNPVQSCGLDGKPLDFSAGSGCSEGGTAYQCADQQPWAVNDTFSYGFAGAFLLPALAGGKLEEAWCCACYQLDFTTELLQGKSMIVQASNTAYDTTDRNQFTLSIPGGNHTLEYAANTCNTQYGLPMNSFNKTNFGVGLAEDCKNVPEPLRAACDWRFGWFKNAPNPTAKFRRVVCPKELTDKSQCIRKDDTQSAQGKSSTISPLSTLFTILLIACVVSL